MAAIVWSDVTDIAAQLATVAAGAQTMILEFVNTEAIDIRLFKLGEDSKKLKLMRVYLAAHLGSLAPRVGIITSESELDLSIGYTIPPLPPGGDPFWFLSSYGQAYSAMVNSTPARLPFVP